MITFLIFAKSDSTSPINLIKFLYLYYLNFGIEAQAWIFSVSHFAVFKSFSFKVQTYFYVHLSVTEPH